MATITSSLGETVILDWCEFYDLTTLVTWRLRDLNKSMQTAQRVDREDLTDYYRREIERMQIILEKLHAVS